MIVSISMGCMRNKKYIIVLSMLLILVCNRLVVSAHESEFPDYVSVVKSESTMINQMIKEMRKHQTQFYYYYPGIVEDFKQYQKKSASYATFLEKLSKKDGYITGVVSGCCITICGEQQQYVSIQVCYLTTKKQERKIDKKVKQIVKRIGKGSTAMKTKRAHDYLIQNMQYDAEYYNPYDAFSKGKGMCMSYALAYQRIMQEMKIPCIYIKGKNHAWNMVKIGKCWYNVDVTWDDREYGRYRYFLKSDADFAGHKRPASQWLSSLKKAKRSYDLSKIH